MRSEVFHLQNKIVRKFRSVDPVVDRQINIEISIPLVFIKFIVIINNSTIILDTKTLFESIT